VSSGVRPASVLGPVYIFTTISWAAYGLVAVSLPFRFEQLGLTVVEYGAVVAVISLGLLSTETLWGALAHRMAERRSILGLGALVAAILVGVGLSDSALTFALSMGLLGAMVIFPVPLLRWLALTAAGPGTGSSGTARYSVFSGSGTVIGAALGPAVFEVIGFFWLAVAAAVLWSLSLAFLLLLPWARLEAPARGGPILRQVRRIATPYFGAAAALVALFWLCYSLTSSFLQYYSVDLFGGTPAESGYVIGGMRAVALAAGLLLGRFSDRRGAARSAPFGFALIAAGTMGTFFSQNYPQMTLATIVFAVGAGWLSVTLLPLALVKIPRALQGTAVGLFGSCEDLGQFVGPIMIGGVYAAYGATSIFIAVAAVAVAGVLGSAALIPYSERGSGEPAARERASGHG
jgi:MFS family permease